MGPYTLPHATRAATAAMIPRSENSTWPRGGGGGREGPRGDHESSYRLRAWVGVFCVGPLKTIMKWYHLETGAETHHTDGVDSSTAWVTCHSTD